MAMALQKFGEYDPGYLECLTTVAVSAFLLTENGEEFIFFSSKFASPDKGISLALRNLGFLFEEKFYPQANRLTEHDALSVLQDWVQTGPVIVGPVDMGKLSYIPFHKDLNGVDHYVVVYELSGEHVFFHDPSGYPYTLMETHDFMKAWKATAISYKRGSFSMWGNLRVGARPEPLTVFSETDRVIAQYFVEEQRTADKSTGPCAIRRLADLVLCNELSPRQRGHLAYFSFPLAARRCGDFSRFYAPYDVERANIKREQGQCLGMVHSVFMKKDWQRVHYLLNHLADLEEEYQSATLKFNSVNL
jgi:hypothetical protein